MHGDLLLDYFDHREAFGITCFLVDAHDLTQPRVEGSRMSGECGQKRLGGYRADRRSVFNHCSCVWVVNLRSL